MQQLKNFFYLFLSCWQIATIATCPRPIVLIHGILSDKYEMKPVVNYIHKYLPHAWIKNITLGLGKITSIANMNKQVEWLAQELQSDPNLHEGCTIIAHSQGGLVARYFIEKYNNPRVYSYISWGTPQMGVFGTPGTLDDRFAWLNLAELYAHKFLYSSMIQKFVSFAGYWRDTLNYDLYLEKSIFLPYLNNEKPHADQNRFKKNICDLEHMVLVNSNKETIIEPAESCHFGFYKIGSTREIEHLFDSDWYQKDKLGLRTLAESGRLHLHYAHCTHTDYQIDEENFVNNTLPYLLPAT